MNDAIQVISLTNLAIAFVPVMAVMAILYKWSLSVGNALHAVARMLVQLLLVGYFLVFIFESHNAWIIVAVLAVMVFASSWIALRTIQPRSRSYYLKALISITLGGGFTLVLVTQGVLELQPWYAPRYLIPLAGMIFANAMNSVSLAGERLQAEMGREIDYGRARPIALRASLIPITNSLFAVGLVSIPGMMTGQILSGISPLIAARYQIMVMCMVYGAAGISAACFLKLVKPQFTVT
jgi:putative ABC transport system permease protein